MVGPPHGRESRKESSAAVRPCRSLQFEQPVLDGTGPTAVSFSTTKVRTSFIAGTHALPTVGRMTFRPGVIFFVLAAVAGLLHAAASLYWALGGEWLLDTVGQFAVDMQRSGDVTVTVMLWIVTLVKIAGALVPLVDHLRLPAHRWVRVVSWLGVAVMLVWGGAGMLGAWIALASGTADGSDRALFGHAYLWDPLFVVWAVLLAVGLLASRSWWRSGRGAELSDHRVGVPQRR